MTHTTATLIRLLFVFIALSTIAIEILLSDEWLLAWAAVWTIGINRLCVSVFKDVAIINDDYYKDSYSSGVNIISLFLLLILAYRYADIVQMTYTTRDTLALATFLLFVAFGAVHSKLEELKDYKTQMDRMVKRHIFKK